jgi:hypothetical protein
MHDQGVMRGVITILDRAHLEPCECYATLIEQEATLT